MDKHKTTVTKIIAIGLKMLKRQSPKLLLCISFADTNQGHLGKIYQAGNWIFTGIAKSTPQYYYNGRWIHQRQLSSLGFSVKGCSFPQRKQLDKFRYLYPLSKSIKSQIEKLRVPYPKEIIADKALK